MADMMSVSSLSSLIDVVILTIMDEKSTTRDTYMRFGSCIGSMERL